MSSSGGASPPDHPTPPGASSDSPPAVAAPVPPVGAPIPASLLGPGAPLSAALGEVGLGVGAPGEDEADMGRLQAMLEARGFPPHLAGVLGPRMHHLILNRSMAPSTMSRAQQLLAGLQATGDESRQLQAVIEMCQLLVMGNEDTLAGFPVRQVVPALNVLLKMEHNFDLMNHAGRALTYMMEALPRSSAVIVDAIPTFLEKLQVIQCMDVAEQSLTALEMLSKKHNKAILHAKGVPACLMYLDFFSISAQNKALTVTANCCQGLLVEEYSLVSEALPVLSSRLIHDDKKSVDTACLALSRLADSYKHDTKKLTEIAREDILTNLQQLLVTQQVSPNTFTTCLHILVVFASNVPTIGRTLLGNSMAKTLQQLLVEEVQNLPGSSTSKESDSIDIIPRSPQELYEITCLVGELLPPLPGDGVFAVDALLCSPGTIVKDPVVWQWQDDRGTWHTYGYNDCRLIEGAFLAGEGEIVLATGGRNFTVNLTSRHEIREESGTARPIQRLLTSQLSGTCVEASPEEEQRKQLAAELAKILFPVLLEIYSASAGPGVRHAALQAMLRMVVHTDSDLLAEVLNPAFLSSQVAAMLSSQDLKIIVSALQLSEMLLNKLPDQFSVHFRREGVLHQVQKLTDPDYSISGNESVLEGSLNMSWAGNNSGSVPGRSWTIAGSSFANMFPEHLRQRSREEGGSSRESPDSTPHPPMRLSDMLKRKRVSSRKSSRKSSGSSRDEHSPQSTSTTPQPAGTTPATSTPSGSSGKASNSTPKSGPTTPGRRSRLSSASSLLSSLHPSRWVRSTSTPHADVSPPIQVSTPTHQQTREKAKIWVRDQAGRFLEQYFRESLGSRHPALTILRRLSAQVDHLAKKPRDGERCLKEIQSILVENDISPFEVTQSGLVPSLLAYLTRPDTGADQPAISHPQHSTTPATSHQAQDHEVLRMTRVRTFLQVFMGCPKASDSEDPPDPDTVSHFTMMVAKLNACVNHLEQFPIKMYDVASGPPGVRSAGSTLKFFKTHHLKCSLQRHPDCTSLKSWKGGLVKIDPLALVQAIERYLVTRGYGKPSDKDSGSDDDDMSDDGPDDTLNNTARDKTTDIAQRLEFMMGEHVLPRDMTVYQAVQQFGGAGSGFTDDSDSDNRNTSMFGSPGIWARIHTIYYRPAQEESHGSSKKGGECSADFSGKKGKGGKWHSKRKAPDELWNEGSPPERNNPLLNFLADKLPREYLQDPSLDVLCLLRVLHALNRYWYTLYPSVKRNKPVLPVTEFINTKLTAKVNRQLQDPIVIMTSNLPTWLKDIGCVCPFLFPFETRQLLFYVTSFDRDRALLRLLDAAPELGVTDTQERVTPDLDRKKRVISRETILKQGEQLMSELASSRSLLEIQYEGEVGTGLGPTLEFYSLVSKEMQRADLQLWKGATVKIGIEEAMEEDEAASDCVEYVHSDSGLYPLPIARNCKSSHRTKIKNKFQFLGKFMAKAVLDNRMIDLPFSQTFYQWLLAEESSFDVADLKGIDPDIAKTVTHLQDIVHKKAKLDSDRALSSAERQEQMSQLTMDGCPVEDLGLDFTLPGYPNIELRKGGRDMAVNLDNLANYVSLVSHWMLIEGVTTQMEAVREGFNTVFPISSLGMFYPDELDQIFCGTVQSFIPWDFKVLSESCKPDHGYTLDSDSINNLYNIMSGYDQDEQRAFLQFVTGCPRLPIGSFKSLTPPLTIVKKTFDTAEVNPDDYLPSVMTCANYLKLPDYSSKKIMKEKLRLAAAEGQYCFHLS
eukprot:GFUD01015622.1.p1 GENE.GFUD01015622.1~~GFUD01015622.1.p1  ORF type:complete len:1754 (-),score=538.42 GFUD01015622.1:509-5770(-)